MSVGATKMLGKIDRLRATIAQRRLLRRVTKALALNKRGEARADGLSMTRAQNRLHLEWRARAIHPWDSDLPTSRAAQLFAEQCLRDADAAISRLFAQLPEMEVIEFKTLDPKSSVCILSGVVTRSESTNVKASSSGMRLKQLGVTYRLHNWRFEPLS
jgi:hypothetical protein